MEELKRIMYFIKVVETKSFSEAAKQLGKAKSVVSRQVTLLEELVGARLLNRSTRNFSLTEVGNLYYQNCTKIEKLAATALDEVRQYQEQPSGTLRIAAPSYFGTNYIVPVIHEFRLRYPHIKISLLISDEIINIVDEGVDLSIRGGILQDSNLVAKKLFSTPLWLVASPQYINLSKGAPTSPQCLTDHQIINLSRIPSPSRWTFTKGTQKEKILINYKIKTNSISAAKALALEGEGITAIASYAILDDVKDGRLIRLLPDYDLQEISFYAVYPQRQFMPPKTRLFLDFIVKKYSEMQWKKVQP